MRRSKTMSEKSAGLPMTAKWDPEKLKKEVETLQVLESQPFFARIRGYFKSSVPGKKEQ